MAKKGDKIGDNVVQRAHVLSFTPFTLPGGPPLELSSRPPPVVCAGGLEGLVGRRGWKVKNVTRVKWCNFFLR